MDYKNGKIYKIVSDNTDKIYIGSTCSPLAKRLYEHKANYKAWKVGKPNNGHVTSYNILELENVDIILLENYPCNDKNELYARERYWIEQNKAIVVNKAIPTRTMREYCKDNKEKIQKYTKEYNVIHKNEKKVYNRLYNLDNKLNISIQKKEYYQKHKEEKSKYGKIYRERNKEKFSKSFVCECGSHYTFDSKRKHIKTAKHLNFIEQEQEHIIKLSKSSFDFIFECDSKMLLPKTYPNFTIL